MVILSLRTRSELGSTFIGVIQRYARELAEHDSRLILAAVSPEARDQIKQVGLLDEIGRENIFVDSEIVGESIHEALDEATRWLAQKPAREIDQGQNRDDNRE